MFAHFDHLRGVNEFEVTGVEIVFAENAFGNIFIADWVP